MSNSQERHNQVLEQVENKVIDGRGDNTPLNDLIPQWLEWTIVMHDEIKRLQAIEETVYDLEASVKLQIKENKKLREVIDKQHVQLDQYESLLNEGVNDHE